jgi:uncharacterized SAM-binding protein YcdF (DUF218 family)
MHRFWLTTMLGFVISVGLAVTSVGMQILTFPHTDYRGTFDCAIILGAAIADAQPSPVFKARLDHGINLYHTQVVKRLIFTGGVGEGEKWAEGEVGGRYAKTKGVPSSAILIERTSSTTVENLQQAKQLMAAEGLKTALIVSDPLHLRRSMLIAKWLGMEVSASATPFSRYRSWKTQLPFLLREIYFTLHFQLFH